MNKTYKIANLIIEMNLGQIQTPQEMEDFRFLTEDSVSPDIRICSQLISQEEKVVERITQNMELLLSAAFLSIYEDENSFFIRYHEPKLLYGYELLKNDRKAICYMMKEEIGLYDTTRIELKKHSYEKPSGEELFLYSIRDIFFFYAQQLGRIAVHSASIIYRNRVWLFSAPSGIGKSTHVAQWKAAGIDCEDFNGDVAICYVQNGKVMAAGLPWSGTSGIYVNRDVELGGINFLERGSSNSTSEMKLSDAALNMNARCLTPNWTRELMELNLDTIERIVPNILALQLRCTPDTEAAFVVQKRIDQYMDGGTE